MEGKLMDYETDYLVIGSGATAMAFVDMMLTQTDATFLMVDRRPKVGGHWNDAYPFVRLHQPSGFYGVASRPLGRHRLDETGFNTGFFELATGVEVLNYFHSLMDEVFIPSKRVQYLPLCEYTDNGTIVSLMSGEEHEVTVNKKVVNATLMTTEVPMTHTPRFEVAEGVKCVPPNHLCRLAPQYKHITILGGGKTGIDSITWLLANDYPADNITWVIPRDSWFYNRRNFQPDEAFLGQALEFFASQTETFATARTVDEVCLGMESAGNWLRLDKSIWPSMFHAAIITETELEQIQRITNVVRLGHVEAINANGMQLTQGEVSCEPDTLYIDCTASGVGKHWEDLPPVFQHDRINLQPISVWQACFSGALIAFIEANIEDEALRQAMTHSSPYTDTVRDFLTSQANMMMNIAHWKVHPEVAQFLVDCRLDGFARLIANISPDDQEKHNQLQRFEQNFEGAAKNLFHLAATA
jgi:hypothetical protein